MTMPTADEVVDILTTTLCPIVHEMVQAMLGMYCSILLLQAETL
jgi:hypothetical protein